MDRHGGPAAAVDERLPMATFWPRRDSCCSGSCSGAVGATGGGRCSAERCQRQCGTWTECGARCSRVLLVAVNFAFLVNIEYCRLSLWQRKLINLRCYDDASLRIYAKWPNAVVVREG